MNDAEDRRGGLFCRSCGTPLGAIAKFCGECGKPVSGAAPSAEYKQVTVLFADVVHSMDIAASVGAERLREIMVDLAGRCASVVQRFGGTVDKFTGDGVMAVFGAPRALEDHAVRACLAALGVQEDLQQLADTVQKRDGIELRLRVGLNSGQVIAGEIGSGSFGYTAVGEQVGRAQRMESIAPPGGIMLSESTARLVKDSCLLGDSEIVNIKGAETPVLAFALLGVASDDDRVASTQSIVVGRELEVHTMSGLFERAIGGRGSVVGVVGPPGIGKSTLVREALKIAKSLGVEVFSTYCESHASQIPFHAAARLFRTNARITGLDDDVTARARVRSQAPGADPDDLLLLDDLLGIADPDVMLPRIDPDARRRRLAALINTANLARTEPILYVMEDAHWIDEASESMMADVLSVIGQTPAVAMITYRPEYDGPLTRIHGAQTIALAPLTESETAELLDELLGTDQSLTAIKNLIAERAAGNPFFAEEIARDLTERGVLAGPPGAFFSTAEAAAVDVPATLHATIAARIDRLDPYAKRTLGAAAVIGSRFNIELLTAIGVEPEITDLVMAQLVDQVRFGREPEYAFHHPLIRAVAYESQLKADRAELHRCVAAAIEERDADSVEQNAALIAEHLEAAGDAHDAYAWHMRAGAWSVARDVGAAITSWERACELADGFSHDGASATSKRVAPRALLCANAFRVRRGDSAARFPDLQQSCEAAGDEVSLAIGMAGLLADTLDQGRVGEASELASEHLNLLKTIGDATLTVGLSFVGIMIKALSAEMADVMRWSQLTIDLAEADPGKGYLVLNSPLALALGTRAVARYSLGRHGWREDLDRAFSHTQTADAMSYATLNVYKYDLAVPSGVLRCDDTALREIREAMQTCEQSGDDFALAQARMSMGFALIHHGAADGAQGVALLKQVRDHILQGGFSVAELPLLDLYIAREHARPGDTGGVLPSMRDAVDRLFSVRHYAYVLPATSILVETLLQADTRNDLSEAETAIDRLAASVEEHQPIRDVMVLRLRTLLAKARGDDAVYRDQLERYRAMADSFGYEGHLEWAREML